MFVFLQNSCAELLTHKVTVLGAGAYSRHSVHAGRLHGGIIKEAPESSFPLPPQEDTGSWFSANQEEGLTRTPSCWYPDLRLLTFRTIKNKFLFFASQAVYSVLL